MRFKVGDEISASQQVEEAMVASHVGSGDLQVFATPAMVTFVERTCRTLIEPHLSAGQTSVGTSIQLQHLAPTPLGATVSVQAEIISIEGAIVTFKAFVRDHVDLVGEAEHTRAIIDVERFLKRVGEKSK